jgi:hypothetical protein
MEEAEGHTFFLMGDLFLISRLVHVQTQQRCRSWFGIASKTQPILGVPLRMLEAVLERFEYVPCQGKIG